MRAILGAGYIFFVLCRKRRIPEVALIQRVLVALIKFVPVTLIKFVPVTLIKFVPVTPIQCVPVGFCRGRRIGRTVTRLYGRENDISEKSLSESGLSDISELDLFENHLADSDPESRRCE